MSTILETRGLTHVYGAGTPFERTALDHVDLKIQKGETLGVIGHTGSGKSTLIQHFNGLLRPSEGEVLLDGQSIWNEKGKCARETRFRVGLVFQYPEYQLFEETIAKDIAFGPTNMGLPHAAIDERVPESMRAGGLDDPMANQSPFAPAGGQKRRVAIAGVLAMKPDIIIFDESTSMLDPEGRAEIMDVAKKLNESGITVITITHNMDEAAQADRIIVLRKGRLVLDGTPGEVFASPEVEACGLALPPATELAAMLAQRGFSFEGTVTDEDTLVEGICAQLN